MDVPSPVRLGLVRSEVKWVVLGNVFILRVTRCLVRKAQALDWTFFGIVLLVCMMGRVCVCAYVCVWPMGSLHDMQRTLFRPVGQECVGV